MACADACPSARCACVLPVVASAADGRATCQPAASPKSPRCASKAAPHRQLKVAQPLATIGGADAETIDGAAAADSLLPAASRACGDRRGLQGAGFRGAWCRCWPCRRAGGAPNLTIGASGCAWRGLGHGVACPAVLSCLPNPRPDRPFIERLHAHLSARTPLATELYVIGCEYVAARPRDGRDDSRRPRPRRDAASPCAKR